MAHYTEGAFSGIVPANTILADTGPAASANTVDPSFWISAQVLSVVELQLRNAANDATLFSHRFWVGALDALQPEQVDFGLPISENERIRLILINGIVGGVQGTLFCQAIN